MHAEMFEGTHGVHLEVHAAPELDLFPVFPPLKDIHVDACSPQANCRCESAESGAGDQDVQLPPLLHCYSSGTIILPNEILEANSTTRRPLLFHLFAEGGQCTVDGIIAAGIGIVNFRFDPPFDIAPLAFYAGPHSLTRIRAAVVADDRETDRWARQRLPV